jgi:hypothetical protein
VSVTVWVALVVLTNWSVNESVEGETFGDGFRSRSGFSGLRYSRSLLQAEGVHIVVEGDADINHSIRHGGRGTYAAATANSVGPQQGGGASV